MNSNRAFPGIRNMTLIILGIAALMACGTQSRKMAGEGAATGAVAGAVGGVVSALVFGGDPAEYAARGAAWGASTGAVAGAMSGARVDEAQQARQAEAQQAQRAADLERLKAEIGTDSFNGLEALADCKHEVALAYARTATRSDKEDYALAGLWLEVLAYADSGEEDQAQALLPDLVAKDSKLHSVAQAEENMRKALQSLMNIREEYDLPRVCS